ncbi:MAG: hypothetical protein EON58_13530, partial [Alphaproteobacteria bacterium]
MICSESHAVGLGSRRAGIAVLIFAIFVLAAMILPVKAGTVDARFNSISDVAVSTSNFSADGLSLNLSLGFVPPVGADLMVVRNEGVAFISGRFSNLSQGQIVVLGYGGFEFTYVANYYGGSGNDLVLHWHRRKIYSLASASWIDDTGVLSGKSVVSVAGGYNFSLALCSDGTIASWGFNLNGQLGNNSGTDSLVPVLVDRSGVLLGKEVIAISAGRFHCLALCSDGTVASWGLGNQGQLGNGTTPTLCPTPVAVDNSGVLNGKTVVAISAGGSHSLVLCSDGTLAAWGSNYYGTLGDGTVTSSNVPVLVSDIGDLESNSVVAISAGLVHNLALRSDGSVLAWGSNSSGQLGNGMTSPIGVAENSTGSGVFLGRTPVQIVAGDFLSAVLFSDGFAATCGSNNSGQLGHGVRSYPSATFGIVTAVGPQTGSPLLSVATNSNQTLAITLAGSIARWKASSAS